MTSFASGLPSNIAVMVAIGSADVAQYFGFAINMAQKIAYLFGEDDLFNENKNNVNFKFKLATLFFCVLPTNLTYFIARQCLITS